LIRASRVGTELVMQPDGQLEPRHAGPSTEPAAIAETEHAGALIESAHERADAVVADAAAEASAIRAESQQLGWERGYAEGAAAARAELADALALVQSIASAGKALHDQVVSAADCTIVELVIAGLAAVLGEQARVDAEIVLRTVERAIARAGVDNVVRIRVHPDDVTAVHADLARRGDAASVWEVFGDGRVGIGGCIIDTRAGEVDARLDVQLQEVAQALRGAVPHAR
jgi:flagellar assembly protein FliH